MTERPIYIPPGGPPRVAAPDPASRARTHAATAAMPDEVARYNGLDAEVRAIARRLLTN